jgi:hypothetical protein
MFLNHTYPSRLEACLEGNTQTHLFREEENNPRYLSYEVLEELHRRRVWETRRRHRDPPQGARIVYEWVYDVVMITDWDTLTPGRLDAPMRERREDYQIGSVTGWVCSLNGPAVDVNKEIFPVKEGDVLMVQVRHEIWPEW